MQRQVAGYGAAARVYVRDLSNKHRPIVTRQYPVDGSPCTSQVYTDDIKHIVGTDSYVVDSQRSLHPIAKVDLVTCASVYGEFLDYVLASQEKQIAFRVNTADSVRILTFQIADKLLLADRLKRHRMALGTDTRTQRQGDKKKTHSSHAFHGFLSVYYLTREFSSNPEHDQRRGFLRLRDHPPIVSAASSSNAGSTLIVE
jgi:hypothetical protein